ncbi:MAG: GlsB/YeaQ/YmgE family stress response membrane protein [Pseudomonadota bacterium]
MGILWTIVLGFVIGVIAKFIHPGKENLGFVMTILLGIAGSFLAGLVGQLMGWYQAGEGAGFIVSVICAIVLLLIYGKVKSA